MDKGASLKYQNSYLGFCHYIVDLLDDSRIEWPGGVGEISNDDTHVIHPFLAISIISLTWV